MTTKIPVALIFFHRRCVSEVLQRIRDYEPEQLYLIADGGRTTVEHAQCQAVRQMVEAAIDWPCRVERLYSDRNLGCRKGIPRGISWVFSQVDQAIIIEEDAVPSTEFFVFCAEMLERYADDTRVMTVSGTNYFPDHPSFGSDSYLFSQYFETPAYGTWARAWRHYDADMQLWPAAKERGLLQSACLAGREQMYWQKAFEEVWKRTCKCDPYDTQWLFAIWLQRGLGIVPRSNLVTNVGGGPEATHTVQADCKFLGRPVQTLGWPLKHPSVVVRSADFDEDHGRFEFYGKPPTAWQRSRSRIVGLLPKSVPVVLRSLKRRWLDW